MKQYQRTFKGKDVHDVYPELKDGRPTGRVIVVWEGPVPRKKVRVTEAEYQAYRGRKKV